jgi:hypothetical protein
MNTLKLARPVVAAILFAAIASSPVSAQNLTSLSIDDDVVTNQQASFAQSGIPLASTATQGPRADSEHVAIERIAVERIAFESIVGELKLEGSFPTGTLELSRTEWDAFGGRLEAALATDHLALNHAALRLVIAYGDKFDLKEEAVFDVMRIYRDDDSERARRMAVVALAEMNSDWALKFLERSSRFEKSKIVKQTILAVLASQGHMANPL